MEHSNETSDTTTVTSLSDLVVRYDMAKMILEANSEFEAVATSRELIDQKAIGNFFNLDPSNNEGN